MTNVLSTFFVCVCNCSGSSNRKHQAPYAQVLLLVGTEANKASNQWGIDKLVDQTSRGSQMFIEVDVEVTQKNTKCIS